MTLCAATSTATTTSTRKIRSTSSRRAATSSGTRASTCSSSRSPGSTTASRAAGSKITVVAFIIMPAQTSSLTVEALKGQAVMKFAARDGRRD